MKRSYKLFVEDILESLDKIERYTKGLTFETFMRSEIVVDAVNQESRSHRRSIEEYPRGY